MFPPCFRIGLCRIIAWGASCRDRDGRTDVYLAYRIRQGCFLPRSLDLGNLAAAVSAVGTPETRLARFFCFFGLGLVNLDLEATHVSLAFFGQVCTCTGLLSLQGEDASLSLHMHNDNCVR